MSSSFSVRPLLRDFNVPKGALDKLYMDGKLRMSSFWFDRMWKCKLVHISFLTLWNQLSNKNQIWYHQVYCWILLKYTIHTYAKYTNMTNIYLNKKTVILLGHINSLLPSTGHHMPIWNYFIIIVSSWI